MAKVFIGNIKGQKGDKGDKGDVVSPEEIGAATAEDMENVKLQVGVLNDDAGRFYSHVNSKDNPHGVTPAQIGAVSKSGDTVGSLTVDGALTVMRSDSSEIPAMTGPCGLSLSITLGRP